MTTKFDVYCDKLDLTKQLEYLTSSISIRTNNLIAGQNIYLNINDRSDLSLIKFLYLTYEKCDANQNHVIIPDFNLVGATVYEDISDSKKSIVNLLKFLIACDFTKEKYAEVLDELIRKAYMSKNSDTIVHNVVIPNDLPNEENGLVTVELVNTVVVRETLILLYKSLFSNITYSGKSYELLDHKINTIPEYSNTLNMKYLSEALYLNLPKKIVELKDASDIKAMLDLGYYLWFVYLEFGNFDEYMKTDVSCFSSGTFSMFLYSREAKCSLSNLESMDVYLDFLKAFYKDVANDKKVPFNFK